MTRLYAKRPRGVSGTVKEVDLKRRTLLLTSVTVAVGGAGTWIIGFGRDRQPLITDPDASAFVYRDGWIVKA